MGFAWTFLKSQFFTKLPYPDWNFTGQTVIITGSNTGLGLEAARHIVRLGAEKVILAVRTISKGETAAASIIKSEHAKKNVIHVWQLDLSDYASVKAFGARLQTLDRLDAFIQNAGILTSHFDLAEGVESTINVNVVSAALVGLLALPKLKETSKKYAVRTRLSFVGSELHLLANCKEAEKEGSLLGALSDKDTAEMSARYKNSKLLLIHTVRELAARSPVTPESNVVINYLTPGACRSELFRDDRGWLENMIKNILDVIIARTTEVGSRTLVQAAKPDISEDSHGAFLMNYQVVASGSNVESAEGHRLQKRWIDELLPKLESISPGVTNVLQKP